MADFSTQKSFIDLSSAHAALTAIAKQQGFKVAKRPTPTGSRLAFDRVASFHCTNASRGCIWQIVLSRSVADAETPWTVYNLCDVHRGVCRPAVLRRKRQASESTVETISTDESDLDIPRELREPRVRSPSLFVPAPNSSSKPLLPAASASQALHPGLALPALGINLQTSSSSNNDEPTPDLTPATTHTSAQTKSPTPDPGAFTAYLEDLLRSLDDPAPGPLPDAGTIDPSAIMAALDQPLSLDFGLPEGTMEWRKGATGAHEFLANMGSEGRKALQPRLERAVSVLQTLNPEAVLQPTIRTQQGQRPFANASGTERQRLKSTSPFPFGMALHGYSSPPDPEERNQSSSEGYGMQLDASESAAEEEEEEASSDDDIPPETLINPGAVMTNGWRSTRQPSVEQYVSPMNLLSPAKAHAPSPGSDADEEDAAPLASTSAAGALLEAAAHDSEAEQFVIPRDTDGDIDIYAIFSSYKHAEATLLANGERFGLPLRVAWAPGHPSSSDGREKRGACLVCVHAGPEGSGVGCGYSVRLSDDSLGKWRLVTSEGEHLPSCYPPKKVVDIKGKGRARPLKEPKAKAKPVHKTRTSYLGAPGSVDRTRLPRAPGESFIGPSSTKSRNNNNERALSPISSFQSTTTAHAHESFRNPLLPTKRSYMRPRSRSRSGSGTESSSPGVVVQASWKPQTTYRVQNQDGSAGPSSSISPQQRRERLNKSGSTKDAPIDLDEEKSADDDDEDAQLKKRKRTRRPRFADQDEVLEISSADDEDEEGLPPPLSQRTKQSEQADAGHQHAQGSASSRPTYARKKLPPSPAHRTPTKPFQARKIRPKPRRPGFAWIEEPAFIADALSSGGKAKIPKELTSSHLNGGYWRKVDDTGNILTPAQHDNQEEEEGRALRSRRRRRGVQTDGVGGKKPVETIVERRRVGLPAEEDAEEENRMQSSDDDDGEAYREPGEKGTPRSLRSSARKADRRPVRSTRARTRRSNAPSRQPPSPGLSFDSRFAFVGQEDDLPASQHYYDDYEEEEDSPPSPAIAKSSLPIPHPRRRSLAARAALAPLAGPSSPAPPPPPPSLPEIPSRLIGNMSLSSLGFRSPQLDLLALGGFYTVSQLTKEGLHCLSEDFKKFRDQFDEKKCFSAQQQQRRLNRGDVKAVVMKIVWEIRANAVVEWEAAGMMESDYDDDDDDDEGEEMEADESMKEEDVKQAEQDKEAEGLASQLLPCGPQTAQDVAAAAQDVAEAAQEGSEPAEAEGCLIPFADVETQAASPSPLPLGIDIPSPPPHHVSNKPAPLSLSPRPARISPAHPQRHMIRSPSPVQHNDRLSSSSASHIGEEPAPDMHSGEDEEEEEEEQESPPRFVLYDYSAVDPDDSEDEFTMAMREIDREEAAEAAAVAAARAGAAE